MTSRIVILSIFGAVTLAAVTLTVLAHGRRTRLVPFGLLLQEVLGRRSVRLVLLLFWWWLGWHLLVEP